MAEESNAVWTIQGCLDWTIEYLERKNEEHPRVSAEWLLSSALGMGRIDLYLNFDRPLSLEERATIRDAVKRRAKGEPLQYITGETSFRGHDIWCEPGVLIPRPETELLTEIVLRYLDHRVIGPWMPERKHVELPWNDEVEAARQAEELARQQEHGAVNAETDGELGTGWSAAENGDVNTEDDSLEGSIAAAEAPYDEPFDASADMYDSVEPRNEKVVAPVVSAETVMAASDPSAAQTASDDTSHTIARVLEVGCGTGCISLSLALERTGRVTCVATDIDDAPVCLAERNRQRYQLDEQMIDIRQGDLVDPVQPDEYGTFDVLVSNPPYIPSAVVDGLGHEVKDYEPRLALDGGKDGLAVFRRLAQAAPQVLKPSGLFACELFETAVEDAAEYCKLMGLSDVKIVADLAHRPRFVCAVNPSW